MYEWKSELSQLQQISFRFFIDFHFKIKVVGKFWASCKFKVSLFISRIPVSRTHLNF